MRLRGAFARKVNALTANLTDGAAPRDPIDSEAAQSDPAYNQCEHSYHIVAGAPANYHSEPCAFEVDATKELGPFTDPATGLGYPNYSFFIPGDVWVPGLLNAVRLWLYAFHEPVTTRPSDEPYTDEFSQYGVLIHPNSGCEVRDHADPQCTEWIGPRTPLALDMNIFSCNALGCDQACPGSLPLSPPSNCTSA